MAYYRHHSNAGRICIAMGRRDNAEALEEALLGLGFVTLFMSESYAEIMRQDGPNFIVDEQRVREALKAATRAARGA